MGNTKVGQAQNTLRYVGTVSLSKYFKHEKRLISVTKNTGNLLLYDFFTDCLLGNYSNAETKRPVKIMMFVEEANGSLSPATDFIYLINRPEKLVDNNSGESAACLSFIVTGSSISGKPNKIRLYGTQTSPQDIDNYLAEVTFTSSISFNADDVLAIDWQLQVVNNYLE